MKVALFMAGHLRDAPQVYENYKQFLENHDTKVYVATWSTYDIDRNTFKIDDTKIDVETITHNIFGSNLAKLWVGDVHKYENNESPHPDSLPRMQFYEHCPVEKLSDYGKIMYPWQQRIIDQWYTLYQCYKLCENYDDFDVCVRIRSDANFIGKPEVPFTDIRDGIHVNGFWWTDVEHRDDIGLVPFRISEQLGWGTPKWMRKYFEYYLHIIELFVPLLQLPDNKFHFGSEHMFAYYLLRYPYFNKNLNPHDVSDHDVVIHKHGHDHRVHSGLIDNDYYTLTAR